MSITPALSTTAGSSLYVSETLPAADSLSSFQSVTGWVEIAEDVDLGEINETYNSVDHVSIDRRKTLTLKGVKAAVSLTWMFGRDISDSGQALLVSYKDSDTYLSYKIVHKDGTIFYFAGPVLSLVTGLSGADTVTSRSVTTAVNTGIYEDVATYFTITYAAGTGGVIVGTPTQRISSGTDGEPVVAVPSTGFNFTAWSDAYTKPVGIAEEGYRQDTSVAATATVTATFAAE